MLIKKTLIRFFYSCDGIKGFLHNPEDFLLSSRFELFRGMGKKLYLKKQKARLNIIEKVNIGRSVPLLISIVMPAYNSDALIKKAIESLQEQSYRYWELLIVDDGSTDNLIQSLTETIEQDRRVKLFKIENNKGVSYARNVGLYYSQGDYVTFHDADDISHPERIESQLYSLIKKPKSSVVVFQTVRVDSNGKLFIINDRVKWNRVSGMMFKRSLIDKIGYFKPLKISEDTEYYERILATYGKESRCILCKTLYYALFSPDSLLFSNANIKVSGNKINYKITNEHAFVLEAYREEHKQIKAGVLNPYQSFEIDTDVTSIYKG